MSEVNDKKALFAFGASLILGAIYVTFRVMDVLPEMLFPTTAMLQSVELLGLLLLVPALLLFCRGLARTTSLSFVDTLKRRVQSTDERLFVAVAMLFVFCASLLLLIFLLGGVPHVQDSIVLMFQAKVFAMGEVGVPAPEHFEFFQYPFLTVENGLLHAKYLPAHSLILALSILLDAELLVQPILAALSLLLIYLLARELYGQLTAKATVLLVAVSPFFLYMHTSFFSHTSCLFFFSLFILSFVKMLKTKSTVFPLIAGLSLGLMFNTRPQTAYIMALALVPIAVKEMLARRKRLFTLVLFVLGLIPAGALTMAYRYPFTGKLIGLPFDFSNPTDKLGFHANVGDLYGSFGHTPLKAWYNFAKNFVEMNSNLFGFPDELQPFRVPYGVSVSVLHRSPCAKEGQVGESVRGSSYRTRFLPHILLGGRGLLWGQILVLVLAALGDSHRQGHQPSRPCLRARSEGSASGGPFRPDACSRGVG